MKEIWPEGWNRNTPYTPGMLSGGRLYISGQLPLNHDTGSMDTGTPAQQTAQVLRNVDAVLTAAGLTRKNVVQCRVYIPDIRYWNEVNEAYGAYFGEHKPARVIVPTTSLHFGARVEIEALAEAAEAGPATHA